MATLRDRALRIISRGWGIVQDKGFTQWTVTVRTRSWSEGEVKRGTATIADLTLSPNPWVEERADGSLALEGITPAYGGVGYTHAQLRPAAASGIESYYSVSGPNGTHSYALEALDDSLAYEIKLRLVPLTRRLPF